MRNKNSINLICALLVLFAQLIMTGYSFSQKVLPLDSLKKCNTLYNSGIKKLINNQNEDAINCFSEALKINPTDIDVLLNRASVYFKIGDKEKACEDWNKIKEMDNKSANKMLKKHCQDKKSFLKKTYLIGSVSYSLPAEKMKIGENYNIGYALAVDFVYEEHQTILSSFGKGLCLSVAGGFNLHPNLGLELEINYLKSTSFETTEIYHYYYGDATYKYTHDGQSINVIPALVIPINLKKIQPYLKLGIILAHPMLKRNMAFSDYLGNHENLNVEYKGNISVGEKTTLGINYFLKQNLHLVLESSLINLLFSPTRKDVTAYTLHGKDALNSLEASKRTTIYQKDYTIKYRVDTKGKLIEDIDTSLPYKAAKFEMPFGSLGFNLGIKYDF